METDAAETRKDAEGLDMMVNMAVDAADDAVKYAQVWHVILYIRCTVY